MKLMNNGKISYKSEHFQTRPTQPVTGHPTPKVIVKNIVYCGTWRVLHGGMSQMFRLLFLGAHPFSINVPLAVSW